MSDWRNIALVVAVVVIVCLLLRRRPRPRRAATGDPRAMALSTAVAREQKRCCSSCAGGAS